MNDLLAGLLLDATLVYWYWWLPIARPWLARWRVEVNQEAVRQVREMLTLVEASGCATVHPGRVTVKWDGYKATLDHPTHPPGWNDFSQGTHPLDTRLNLFSLSPGVRCG